MGARALILLMAGVAVVVSGCSENTPAAPEVKNTYVNVIIQHNENDGVALSQYVAYACDSNGATITTAAISMSGPGGALPGTLSGGVFAYQDLTGASFANNAVYAVSVTCVSGSFYAVVSTNGDIVIAADGSTVAWGYDAESEIISVITPAPGFLFYGPLLNSPYNLAAAGAFSAGSGTYTISAAMTDQKAMTVTGAGCVGKAVIQHMKSASVDR